MVESQPSKLLVAGSIPVSRSNLRSLRELRLARQRGNEGRLPERRENSARHGGGLRLSQPAVRGERDAGTADA